MRELNDVILAGGLCDIPPFTFVELQHVLKQLKVQKTRDADGIVAEMFKFGSDDLSMCLLQIFNSMLQTGNFQPAWQNALFTMLLKHGDSSQPSNWRPIAVLKITYSLSQTNISQVTADIKAGTMQ